MAEARTKKKKVKKNVPVGIVHIQASFNNTLVTVTDPSGDVISWSSSGCNGFKGTRKSTPFAAQVTAEQAVKKAKEMGVRTISILVKGPGAGRESALRAISGCGVTVTSIKDITPVPHNGCRPRKSRRV
ncbi:MAG: 30S ribosomal protein S11 [Bdellovibrionota bacterium]